MSKRIEYIDFLKVIGLTGIIIAHVGSPNWLMMLRSFDVPLMVIISSLLASYSIKKYDDNNKSTLEYYVSRFKRLIIPTYTFLIIYFTIQFILTKEFMGTKYYLETFLLTRYGFSYVWIILIYLYSAFLIPVYKKIGYNIKSIVIVLLIYIVYELLYFYGVGVSNKIIDTTVFYIVPYGLLTFVGFNIDKMKNKEKKALLFINLIIFILLAYYYFSKTGSFQIVQIAKYPPRIYYISYGLFCSILLILLCNKYKLRLFKSKIITYISNHSMWIYLWHILTLDIYKYLKLPEIWFIKLLFVYILALSIVIFVNKIIKMVETKHKYSFLKYFK